MMYLSPSVVALVAMTILTTSYSLEVRIGKKAFQIVSSSSGKRNSSAVLWNGGRMLKHFDVRVNVKGYYLGMVAKAVTYKVWSAVDVWCDDMARNVYAFGKMVFNPAGKLPKIPFDPKDEEALYRYYVSAGLTWWDYGKSSLYVRMRETIGNNPPYHPPWPGKMVAYAYAVIRDNVFDMSYIEVGIKHRQRGIAAYVMLPSLFDMVKSTVGFEKLTLSGIVADTGTAALFWATILSKYGLVERKDVKNGWQPLPREILLAEVYEKMVATDKNTLVKHTLQQAKNADALQQQANNASIF